MNISFDSPKGNVVIRQVELNEVYLLRQIFKLRVSCRQESKYITYDKYPNGWFDDVDFVSQHFAAFCNEKIIAAGRISFFENIAKHPYFPALEKILPENLLQKPIAYLSRDQVSVDFRGLGIRNVLLNEREKLCRAKNISDLFIDVATDDSQFSNFNKDGYEEVALFDTSKIKWDVGSSILMHKILQLNIV